MKQKPLNRCTPRTAFQRGVRHGIALSDQARRFRGLVDDCQIADAIVADLFGSADHLMLTVDGPPRRDLGGWGRGPASDRIRAILQKAREEVRQG